MKLHLKQIWLLICLSLVLSACKRTKVASEPSSPPADFALLHINDVYEISPLSAGKTGGMARVATLRQQLKQDIPQVYTLLAGDFLSPSVIGTVKLDGERIQGAQMVDMMNAVGVDWVIFGNHEFDVKPEALQARLDESNAIWLAGNVKQMDEAGPQPFQQRGKDLPVSQVVEIPLKGQAPFRLGILSLCLPVNQQDWVHYEELRASALAQWADLSERSDAVVAITHQTIEQDRMLAKWLPELKLIMGGHEHEAHIEKVQAVPITKADANAKSAYIHRFWVDPGTRTLRIQSTLQAIDKQIALDPTVQDQVQAWEQKAYVAFQKQGLDLEAPVTTLSEPLDGLEIHIRAKQTNLGAALTGAMFDTYPDLDGALINSGAVRIDDYLQGDITQFDLVRTLPFGGKVLRVELKGSLLEQILQVGEQNKGSGGYLQRHQLKPLIGKSDLVWMVAGQPLQADQVYAVAMGDFLLTGLEKGLDFLTPDHPGIIQVDRPGTGQPGYDIRLSLVEYLKKP